MCFPFVVCVFWICVHVWLFFLRFSDVYLCRWHVLSTLRLLVCFHAFWMCFPFVVCVLWICVHVWLFFSAIFRRVFGQMTSAHNFVPFSVFSCLLGVFSLCCACFCDMCARTPVKYYPGNTTIYYPGNTTKNYSSTTLYHSTTTPLLLQNTRPVLLCTTPVLLQNTTPVLLQNTTPVLLQSSTPVLLCTTPVLYSKKLLQYYYKVLPQYYSALQSTSTTKYFSRTTLYFKVLQSTTPALFRITKHYPELQVLYTPENRRKKQPHVHTYPKNTHNKGKTHPRGMKTHQKGNTIESDLLFIFNSSFTFRDFSHKKRQSPKLRAHVICSMDVIKTLKRANQSARFANASKTLEGASSRWHVRYRIMCGGASSRWHVR